DGLVARAAALGASMLDGLRQALAGNPIVRNVRGHGLMLGIELDRGCSELVTQALAAGLLINVTADKVVRLLPALVMTDEEAAQVVARVAQLVNDFASTAA